MLAFISMLAFNVSAADLCDPACDIQIDFTDGGSIEAIEPLDIVFGSDGILELGAAGTLNVAVPPASLDYSTGGVLSLAAGESISFGAGGMLDLGDAGNIDYTVINVVIGGEISIDTTDDTGTVQVTAGSTFTWNTGSSWTTASNWNNSGTISLANGVDLSSGANFSNTISGTLSIGSTTFSNVGLISVSEIETGIVLNGGSFIQTITPGSFAPIMLTQEGLAFFEGVEMMTADGGSCTVTDGECFADTGAKYIVNADGELVPAEGSSRLSPVLLFMLMGWMLLRKRIVH